MKLVLQLQLETHLLKRKNIKNNKINIKIFETYIFGDLGSVKSKIFFRKKSEYFNFFVAGGRG